MNIKEKTESICGLPGPAGFEEQVALYAKKELDNYMDKTWIDVMGNVIGVRYCGREKPKKLLFDAHIDEIGFIVTGVEEGFLKFSTLGGFDARVIPAAEVMVCSQPPVYGVISVLPPHILKKEDTEKNFKIEDLFIDIGQTHDEAVKLVQPGTHGVFTTKIRRLGDDLIYGKAIDDRAGFVSILYALDMLKDIQLDVDLYVMASVQEEVGVRGAATGAYSIDPDYCVVIDVDHAKTPDAKPTEANIELGEGVVITRGPNMNPGFTEKIVELAKNNDIKYQINVMATGSSGTNARAIQISREGVVTALFGLPLRYMHSANEVSSTNDIKNTARLLFETTKAMKGVI